MSNVTTNIDQVNAKLEGLKVTRHQLELAGVVGLLPVQALAKSIVKRVTGTLARSIHIGGHSDQAADFRQNEPYSDIGFGAQHGGNTVHLLVGTNVEYAKVQEFRPGKAYLRPAFDAKKDEIDEEVKEALKIIIHKAAS